MTWHNPATPEAIAEAQEKLPAAWEERERLWGIIESELALNALAALPEMRV